MIIYRDTCDRSHFCKRMVWSTGWLCHGCSVRVEPQASCCPHARHTSFHALRVLWPLCSIASSSSLSCALSTLNCMVLFGPGQHFRALLALCVSYTWRPGGRLSPVGRRVGGPMKDAPTMCASAHVDWSEGWPYFEVRAISMPHDTSVGARASA